MTVRWGIIGPGSIARTWAADLRKSATGRLVAVATRRPDRPGLADAFAGARIIEGYQRLLEGVDIDAIYVATPHNSHAEWAIKAAEAGKHVLVEKPMALNAAEAEAMVAAARRHGVFLGEAFMYRLHPMTRTLGDLVAGGAIGEVRMIQSSFGIQMEDVRASHPLYVRARAGGGILDLGAYPVSMARFVAGVVLGDVAVEPDAVFGVAHLGPEGVDEWAMASLSFERGIMAQLACAISLPLDNILRVYGATGWLEVCDFWSAGGGRGDGLGRIEIVREEGPREVVTTPGNAALYLHEIDAANAAIIAGRCEFDAPGMTWSDSLANMRTLDRWRAGAGVAFDSEA